MTLFFTAHINAQNTCLTATTQIVNLSGSGCNVSETALLTGTDAVNPLGTTAPCTIASPQFERWEKFTAIAPTATISVASTNPGVQRELAVVVYSGTCGSLTQIGCANNITGSTSQTETLTLTGLTYSPATDYFIRIINEGSSPDMATSTCIKSTPINDEPNNPVVLNINNGSMACSVTASDNYFATNTNCNPSIPNPSCTSYTPGISQDVWYSVLVPLSGNLVINSTGAFALALYSGTNAPGCGSMTEIICSEFGSPANPAQAGFSLSGLTQGVYYIRAWKKAGAGAISFCASSVPIPPPVNDEPCGAVTATVSPGALCATINTISLLGATASIPVPSCAGLVSTVEYTDVWAQFTATASIQTVSLSAVSPNTAGDRRVYVAVYAAGSGSCSPVPVGPELLCSSNAATTLPQTYTVTGLTAGQNYLLRFFNYSIPNYSTTISYCITTPIPPTDNNECLGAIAVTPDPGLGCSVVATGSLFPASGATASFQSNGCAVGSPVNDIWYSFVATSTSHSITLNTTSTADFYHSVYAGTCGSLGPAIICADPNNSIIFGLTVGHTYFVRVYAKTAPALTTATGTFVICINTPTNSATCFTPAGSNDFCPNPTSLSQSPYTFTGTVGSPTVSGGIYTSDVPGNLGNIFGASIESNSWYSFIAVTPTHTFNIVPAAPPACTVQARVFKVDVVGTCCVSFTTMSNLYSSTAGGVLTASSLSVGATYYLMVDGASAANCTYSINTWVLTSTLPVEFVSFTGDNEGKRNVLNWTTSSEKENLTFYIEHSQDGTNFETISSIKGKGNGSLNYYTAYDDNPFENITYYRLKQSENSAIKYSNIISVNLKNKYDQVFNIHPNPTTDNIMFDYYSKINGNIVIELLSYTGISVVQTVHQAQEGKNSITLPMNALSNGVYTLKVASEQSGKSSYYKVIKN